MSEDRFPTPADVSAMYYNPAENDYRLADDPRCLFGWGPGVRKGCRHMFGHACFRALGHRGKCIDHPLEDACARAQRPKNWDSKGRAEANR